VAHTEAKGDHVLLGQLMFHPVRPNSVAQGAEVPAITVWDLSAGTHSFKAGSLRARTPRTKVRIGEGKGGCKADHKSLYSVCPDEPLSFAMLGEKPGDLSDVRRQPDRGRTLWPRKLLSYLRKRLFAHLFHYYS
jgi:hypothetical protein